MAIAGRKGASGPANMLRGSVTVDFTSIAAATVSTQTVAIAEALPGDTVLLTPPAGGVSVAVGVMPGYVASAGSCRVPVVNPTAGALDAASAVFNYTLLRG